MREVRRSALVPYTPEQMYALVNDVRRYPDFLPWVPSIQVHDESAETISATVNMQRAGVRIALTTRNFMRPGEHIEMTLVDGPMQSFAGHWAFVPIRGPAEGEVPGPVRGCRVELLVSFAFRSAALGVVLGPLFESTWNSIVDAFVRRAREIYHAGA
ncbi:MAG: type II toxin-antitoxin system RatA family toxin [Proteobacteria bacterium]|nr:type II toxin-antitoxin system RatA family toxin [Pseudomonadota bacterium]